MKKFLFTMFAASIAGGMVLATFAGAAVLHSAILDIDPQSEANRAVAFFVAIAVFTAVVKLFEYASKEALKTTNARRSGR